MRAACRAGGSTATPTATGSTTPASRRQRPTRAAATALYNLPLYASNPVTVEAPAGWHSACGLSTSVFLSPESPSACGIDFGAAPDRCGVATGTVYEDADAGGTREGAEAGLEGWLVYSDENGDGAFDNNEPNATTASDGTYSLSGLRFDTTEAIRVTPQPGWTQTAPGCGGISWAWTTAYSPTACGLDFGVDRPVLNALTVTDRDYAPNTVVNSDGSTPADITVFETPSTDASGADVMSAGLTLAADYSPAGGALGQILWRVTGDGASPASGSVAENSAVAAAPQGGAGDYVVEAGVDANGNGDLDGGEVSKRVYVHVASVQVELNGTPETNDDLVLCSTPGYGPDMPPETPTLDGTARIVGGHCLPGDLPVTLDNPDGRIAFVDTGGSVGSSGEAGAATALLTLPKDGTPVPFRVVGMSGSAVLGDARICVAASGGDNVGVVRLGGLLGVGRLSVVWFQDGRKSP